MPDKNIELEIQELRQLATSIFSTTSERKLLYSITVVLFILGVLLLGVTLLLYSNASFWRDLILNISTELIGSVGIFFLLGLTLKSLQNSIGSGLTPRDIIILIVIFGLGLFWYAYVVRFSTDTIKIFIRDVNLNIVAEIAGSLILFFVLEGFVSTLETRDRRIEELLEKIDDVAQSLSHGKN